MLVQVDTSFSRLFGGPNWQCPTCGLGLLQLVRETINDEDTRETELRRTDGDWTDDKAESTFTCRMRCSNIRCTDSAIVAGRTERRSYFMPSGEVGYHQVFIPLFVHPSPVFVEIPRSLPREAADELRSSFTLFWFDAASAANKIRLTVELLLTDQGIPRFTIAKGKRKGLGLQQRIDKFKQRPGAPGEIVEAVKWIGNAGSHSGDELTREDVIDAFAMMGNLVDEFYDERTKKIQELAKEINASKGPRPRKPRPRLKPV